MKTWSASENCSWKSQVAQSKRKQKMEYSGTHLWVGWEVLMEQAIGHSGQQKAKIETGEP